MENNQSEDSLFRALLADLQNPVDTARTSPPPPTTAPRPAGPVHNRQSARKPKTTGESSRLSRAFAPVGPLLSLLEAEQAADAAAKGTLPSRLEPLPPAIPVDMPTESYAAIAVTPGFEHYVDYPARVHHLRDPTAPPRRGSSPFAPSWEDIHLHQRVSVPRVHARWARDITPADRANMTSFLRFVGPDGRTPVMGFRPHKDLIYLDGKYLASFLEARTTAHRRLAAPPELIPFIAAADRAKIDTLAVSGRIFHSGPTRASMCEVLARTFPCLRRLILTAPAIIDRPAVAGWDLESEFALWGRRGVVKGKMQVEKTSTVAGSVDRRGPDLDPHAHGAVFFRDVQMAFVRARRDLAERRTRGDQIRNETELPTAGAALSKSERRYTGMYMPVRGESGLESDSDSQNSTCAVVGIISNSLGAGIEHGPVRELTIEAYALLYYRDAFNRAVENGWVTEELVSADNLDWSQLQ